MGNLFILPWQPSINKRQNTHTYTHTPSLISWKQKTIIITHFYSFFLYTLFSVERNVEEVLKNVRSVCWWYERRCAWYESESEREEDVRTLPNCQAQGNHVQRVQEEPQA